MERKQAQKRISSALKKKKIKKKFKASNFTPIQFEKTVSFIIYVS